MLLAEKVETRQQFLSAREMGYVYFQGYFFRRPEVLKAKEIPANRVNYLRMLEAFSRAELDVRELESLITTEASLLYRLLRYLNSPMFAFKNEIHSVRHALSILSERETRRWIRLVTLVAAGMQRSTDLVLSALVRAILRTAVGEGTQNDRRSVSARTHRVRFTADAGTGSGGLGKGAGAVVAIARR